MNERPAPGIAASPEVIAGPHLYREAMSRVAGSVQIAATDGPGGLAGLTATAFASVSDAPPTVILCVGSRTRFLGVTELNTVFSVNTLAAGDESLAEIFAGRTGIHGAERFAAGAWSTLATGAPLLDTALVSFDCRLVRDVRVATHHILVGAVVDVRLGTHGPALIYRDRGYRQV